MLVEGLQLGVQARISNSLVQVNCWFAFWVFICQPGHKELDILTPCWTYGAVNNFVGELSPNSIQSTILRRWMVWNGLLFLILNAIVGVITEKKASHYTTRTLKMSGQRLPIASLLIMLEKMARLSLPCSYQHQLVTNQGLIKEIDWICCKLICRTSVVDKTIDFTFWS